MTKIAKIKKRTWSTSTYKTPVMKEEKSATPKKHELEAYGRDKNFLSFVVPWQLSDD